MTFPCHEFCRTEFQNLEFHCDRLTGSKLSGLVLPHSSGGVFTFKF